MKKSIYKVVSIIVIMAIALTMTAFAEGEAVTATLSRQTVKAGEEFELTVSFSNCDEVKAFQVSNFKFGKNVLLLDAMHSIEGAAISSWKNGKLLVAFEENTKCNGEILKLLLKADENAVTGDYEIPFEVVIKKMSNGEEVVVPSVVTYSKLTIEGLPPENTDNTYGNLEGDGTTDKNETSENKEPAEEFTSQERAEDVICLKIDNPTAFAYGKYGLIDSSNEKVVPYIKNDRTLVPLRFVSETLGAQVEWENGWNYCYVNKGDKKIKITFGSADIEVNGEVITCDAPVEVVEDRTMVPIRFISEELGYHVYWNQPNQVVVITPVDNPWIEKRSAENDLLLDMLVTFLLNGMI